MSLEQALQENTAAIKELIAAWLKAGGVPVAAAPAESEQPEQKAETKNKAKAALLAAKPKPEPKPEPEPQPEPQTEPTVDYPTLQKAVFALANAKGRDAVVELIKAEFGVGSAKELKPGQWADALAKVNAALEG